MKITILYGSQTGTAKETSYHLLRTMKRHHIPCQGGVLSMDEYLGKNSNDFLDDQLAPALYVFICSTTGQGDFPDNMKRFWRFLCRKKLPDDFLRHRMKFCCFGLGDSGYKQYNWVAKKLRRRLMALGAEEVYQLGLGNDQESFGVDQALIPWIAGLLNVFLNVYPLNGKEIIPREKCPDAQYVVQKIAGESQVDSLIRNVSGHAAGVGEIVENTRLTPDDHWQDVRHFEIQCEGLSYQPGDVLAIYPQNTGNIVDDFLKRFNLDPKQLIRIGKAVDDAPSLPVLDICLSLRDYFTHYADIQGTPRRYFFELLSHFTTNEKEKERLHHFGMDPEGLDDLYRYNHREKRTYLEVFQDFPNSNPPLQYLIEMIPPIQPRQFSIASSLNMHKDKVQLLVAIVNYVTPYNRTKVGMCTSWMKDLKVGEHVPIWVQPGTFKKPQITDSCIFIGPGTGLAPFRSMIEDRVFNKEQSGETMLFFGNRNANKDFFYKDQLQHYHQDSTIPFYLVSCFSRDQENKIYVQHKLKEMENEVWNLITFKGAKIFIAGNAEKMPDDVRRALIKIAMNVGKKNQYEAEDWMKRLERLKLIQQETWS